MFKEWRVVKMKNLLMRNKIVFIPIALTLFVMFYGTVEQNVDCPTVAYNPEGNEDCTYVKSWLWHSVAILSLTAFGLPPDGVLTEPTVNPDEAEGRNFIPMLAISIIALFIIKRKESQLKKVRESYR